MKYKVHRIRSDMFRIYPNRKQSGYDVKSIHTTVPRMCKDLNDAVRIMHILLDLKHEVIPGAFMNQIRRNHPKRIYIKGLKRFRIKEFAVMKVDSIIPNWRIYDLSDHKVIAYLDTQQEALQFLHEYYGRRSKMKHYRVFTQDSYGDEKFYIEDDDHDVITFIAESAENAMIQAAEYIRESSIYDEGTTEEWINRMNWHVEEVEDHE